MINKLNPEGWNAIHFAVFYAFKEILEYFIGRYLTDLENVTATNIPRTVYPI